MTALQKWMDSPDGLSEVQLAEKVGVSRVQIFRLRKGDNKPSPQTALKLQEITGIPAAKLVFGEDAAA